MRVKLSKLLSAVLAICVVFAGFTAFAAPATVVTTTNYAYDTHNDGNDGIKSNTATMTIVTTVSGAAENSEITYLVVDTAAVSDPGSSNIVYIDQATATDGSATFRFTANQGKLFAATAKYGTDDETLAGLPTFTFNHGVNFMSNGDPSVTTVSARDYLDDGDSGKLFLSKVSGEVKEYGIVINDIKYPAMGCDNEGNFAVLISGIDTTDAEVEAYAE